ncbi:hypothetical protein FPQ18DRAFT_374036 [Pyronema domesticum]|nr:hypothetical protein FPQ18DRAFT_374036 [Pyronema domesticum]
MLAATPLHDTPPLTPTSSSPPLLSLLPASLTPTLPTALLPLLTPILRNRLKLLSTPSDPWALLLSWNSTHATHLLQHLSTLDLCSPAFGILLGLSRLDPETLKAAIEVPDLGLVVIYIWSPNDPDGEDDAWRVLDVLCAEDVEGEWYPTVEVAEAKFSASQTSGGRTLAPVGVSISPPSGGEQDAEGDEEDDYWAQYDRSSAATPAARELDNPPTEDDYFKQYEDVTPALDGPSAYGPTSAPELHNYAESVAASTYPEPSQTIYSGSPRQSDTHSETHSEVARRFSMGTATSTSTPPTTYSAPRAISPSLSATASGMGSEVVRKMEESAGLQTQMETAVKQHVATSVKSMYRLAKVSGMGREEFMELVKTELEVLGMMDEDD